MSEQALTEASAARAFAESFVKALAAMPDVHKDKKAQIKTKDGGNFSYAYADLASIIALVRPVLAEHGLVHAQATDTLADGTVSVTTRIYHEGGHVESFGTLTLAAGADARQAGSAVTYARRYSLCAALGIAPDEDTDGAGVGAPAASRTADDKRTDAQNRKMRACISELDKSGIEPPDGADDWAVYAKRWIFTSFGKESSKDLTKSEAGKLIDHLEAQAVPFG